MFPKVMWVLWNMIVWMFQNLFLVEAFGIENGRVLFCMSSRLGCHQDVLLQADATSVSHLWTNQALVAPWVQSCSLEEYVWLLAWLPCVWRAGVMEDHVKKQHEKANKHQKYPKPASLHVRQRDLAELGYRHKHCPGSFPPACYSSAPL